MSTNDSRKPEDRDPVSQRYLFETCFDSDRMAGGSQDDVAEPTFTLEDMENARAAAHAEGEMTGRQDAVNSIEKQLLNGLGRLVEQMCALSDDQMRFQQDLTERSVELALKATRKMFPALAQRDGLVEIDALLTNCLLEAKEEPRIMVRVSTALAEPYRERIDALAAAAGYQGAVTVLPDDAFGPADCRIEWSNGGAERVAAQMWRDFDAATQRIFSDPADEGDALADPTGPEAVIETSDGAPEIPNGHADEQSTTADSAAAELIIEPVAEPAAEPIAEALGPTFEPVDLQTGPPAAPDNPDSTSPAEQPPHPATAS